MQFKALAWNMIDVMKNAPHDEYDRCAYMFKITYNCMSRIEQTNFIYTLRLIAPKYDKAFPKSKKFWNIETFIRILVN